MNQQKKKLFIGLGVLVVLVAAYFALTLAKQNRAEMDEEGNYIVTNVPDLTAKTVAITQEGETNTFQKEGTEWVWVGHESEKLVQISIDQLVAYAKGLEASQVVSEDKEADGTTYGFDTAKLVEVTGEDGTVISLSVGDQTVDETGYYVTESTKDEIFLVDAEAGKALSRGILELRSRIPDYVDYNNCKNITFTNQDGSSYTISKNQEEALTPGYGEYLLSGVYAQSMPVVTEVLTEQVGAPLDEIAVVEFLDNPGDLAQYGLDTPRMTIFAEDMDGNTCTIWVGDDCDDLTTYARFSNRDYVCTISKENIDSVLQTKPFDLIGKNIMTTNAADMKELKVVRESGTDIITITKEGETFSYTLNDRALTESDFSEVYKQLSVLTRDGEYPAAKADEGTEAAATEQTAQSAGEAAQSEAQEATQDTAQTDGQAPQEASSPDEATTEISTETPTEAVEQPVVTIYITGTDQSVQELLFYPYDENYYVLEQFGQREFLVGIKTVELFTYTLDALK